MIESGGPLVGAPPGDPVLGGVPPGTLPPLHNLPSWSRVNTLDRARYPKPFMKDRLEPLAHKEPADVQLDLASCVSDAASDDTGISPSARLQHMERSLHFLQQQHRDVLQQLHEEIDMLKRHNQELQFQACLPQRGSPMPSFSSPAKSEAKLTSPSKPRKSPEKHKSASTKHEPQDEVRRLISLEAEVKDTRRALQVERGRNDYLTRLIEQAQARFPDGSLSDTQSTEAQSAPPHSKFGCNKLATKGQLPFNARLDPLKVVDMAGTVRIPTADECEVIIKHLLQLNDHQSNELSQLKSDLRDVLYSHKWSPDAYLLAKAYVVDDNTAQDSAAALEGAAGGSAGCRAGERLPRLTLKQPQRKLPELAHVSRDQVMLPALRQTMGNKAIERRKRTQILQKSRQRRETFGAPSLDLLDEDICGEKPIVPAGGV